MTSHVILDYITGYEFEFMQATMSVYCTKFDANEPDLTEESLRWIAASLFVVEGSDLYIGVLK